MRQFWKELFPRKKSLELFVYLLGREGSKIEMSELTSCLNMKRENIYRAIKHLQELTRVHNVPLKLSVNNAEVLLKKDTIQEAKVIKNEIAEIIDYLNLKSGKRFKYESNVATKHINARIKEGFTIDDFKYVIDTKCTKWIGSNMEDYLRPETLFSTKFQSYLNERPTISKIEQTISTLNNEPTDWGMGE